MENIFKIKIISPEKTIFSDENVQEAIIPAYEGEMGILKDHISIISFLKPGVVKVFNSSKNTSDFFVEDGIIEFCDNNLTILSSTILEVKNLNKEKINQLIADTKKILDDEKLDDNNRYIANHKVDVLSMLSLN